MPTAFAPSEKNSIRSPAPRTDIAPFETNPFVQTQLVLFDLGGVLIELGGVEEFRRLVGAGDEDEVWRRWLSSPSVRRFERGLCDRQAFATGMIQENGLKMTPGDFLEMFGAWPRGMMPGASELVSSLAAGLQRACLSNTNELHWREQRDAENIQSLFEMRFLSFELGLVKPDREIFEFVLRATGVPGEAILFLDDNAINVDGALDAVGVRKRPKEVANLLAGCAGIEGGESDQEVEVAVVVRKVRHVRVCRLVPGLINL